MSKIDFSIRGATKRLVLKPPTVYDVTQVYIDALNDIEVTRYTEARNTRWDWENTFRYIESTGGLTGLFIGGKYIGNVHVYETSPNTAEIGIMIFDKSKWGQGYSPEALTFVVNHLFSHTNITSVKAGYYKTNIRSEQAFRKAGFVVEIERVKFEKPKG